MVRHPNSTLQLFAVPALLLFLAGLAPALLCQEKPVQEKKRKKDRTFEGFSQVIEIEIPVNVSMRDGSTVRGLTVDDFEIFDEGKRQPIADFEVIDLELVTPGVARSEVEAAVPGAARRHFLLLFDLSFSSPVALVKARSAARDFVMNELHPTDLAAVATHAVGSGVNMVVTFTPDRVQLARAIDTLGSSRFLSQARGFDPLRFLVDPLGDGNVSSTGSEADNVTESLSGSRDGQLTAYFQVLGKTMQRMERSFARGRVSEWARGMKELGRVLDSVKGRKHVVVLSEGFDGRLLFGRQPDADDREMQEDLVNLQFGNYAMVDTDDIYGNTPLQTDFTEMVEQYRRADTIIQTVDISGLNAESAADARVRSVSQAALFYIANETGGELYEDANNFGDQLNEVLKRSSVTYLLTIRPKDIEANGEYRRLKVKVKQKGARVSARAGYYSPRPFKELHPIEKELLASDAIAAATPRDDVRMDVLAAAFRADDTSAYVPVIIELEGESLLLGHEDDELQVEFYAYVTNERGEMKDFFTQLVTLDISGGREQLKRTGVKYYGHLTLGEGEHLIRVLARNASTGRTAVAAVPLEIPDFESDELALLPPFFLEDPGLWGVLVRENSSKPGYESSIVYPFTVNGEPYIPAARPRLATDASAEICLVAYNLSPGELEVEGRIVDAGGDQLALAEMALLERTVTGIDGLDKLRATFRPGSLAAGDYLLEVEITDRVKGVQQTSSIPFLVLN